MRARKLLSMLKIMHHLSLEKPGQEQLSSFINIFGLAIGLGTAILIFVWIQ